MTQIPIPVPSLSSSVTKLPTLRAFQALPGVILPIIKVPIQIITYPARIWIQQLVAIRSHVKVEGLNV